MFLRTLDQREACVTCHLGPGRRAIHANDPIIADSFTQLLDWNGNDSLEKVTYAAQSGRHVQYLYDNGQRISSIGTTQQPALYAGSFSYHPSGPPLS